MVTDVDVRSKKMSIERRPLAASAVSCRVVLSPLDNNSSKNTHFADK